MYFNYTSRSLFRGGQRTVLALFCVAVGVMAIVALQLVGIMINDAMTANVRDANGGGINITSCSGTKSFVASDLSYFNQLKAEGTITNYTALDVLNGSFSSAMSLTNVFSVGLVDPSIFPLVAPPIFTNPSNGNIASLLSGNGAIIDQKIAD